MAVKTSNGFIALQTSQLASLGATGPDDKPDVEKGVGVNRVASPFDEPIRWSVAKLGWRDQGLKTDSDREVWLLKQIPEEDREKIKSREALIEYIEKKHWIKSRWDCCTRLQWIVGACGLCVRWRPVAYERLWIIILFVYGSLWMNLTLTSIQKWFGTDNSDPISFEEFMVRFKNTVFATLAWSVFALLAYEVPRIYTHCFKCRFGGPRGIRCVSSKESRLKRSRLEKCVKYDQSLDEETAIYAYEFQSDTEDDPDIFIYYHHHKGYPNSEKTKHKSSTSGIEKHSDDESTTPFRKKKKRPFTRNVDV